ncbi:hypothetical protein B0T16DRAFT_409537 [Cercophora newfieldiana]|uniref:Uncharacterized protein n=1 Tax=Cercophora newfieldiana TaxID=92897 RepID=A0AA40CTY4_9PEZI|nr:hypothetical protein B0T16DRAFT_409537 [Cercophora newfieldiana]
MEYKTQERNDKGRIELPSEWETTQEPPTAMSTLPRELLLPYPAWTTYLFRGTVAVYETGVLAFAVWLFTKWQRYKPDDGNGLPFPKERLAIPLIVMVAALLTNLSALIATATKRYHVAGLWRWAALLDAAVGALGLYGSITMTTGADNGKNMAEIPWHRHYTTAATMLFALG